MRVVEYTDEGFERFRQSAADHFHELRAAARIGGAQIVQTGEVQIVRVVDQGEYVLAAMTGEGFDAEAMAEVYEDAKSMGLGVIRFLTRRAGLVHAVRKLYPVSVEGTRAGYRVCRIKVV